MDLSDGSRLGMIGSAMLVVAFLIALVLGVWAVFFVLSTVAPILSSYNSTTSANSLNMTQIYQLESSASSQFTPLVELPGIGDAILEIIGIVLFGLGVAAYGKKYNNTTVTKYSYYATVVMAVGFAVSLLSVGLPNTFTIILTIVGAVIFAYVIGKLSAEAKYNNLKYYGYGLVVGAVLQFFFPLDSVAFVVVFALFIFAFRNLRTSEDVSPFDANPSAVVTNAAAQGSRKSKKK